MSADLDDPRTLDHVEVQRFLDELQPREWAPGERDTVEAALDAHDPDEPAGVLPSLPQSRAA